MRAPRDSNPQPQSYSGEAVGGPRATTEKLLVNKPNGTGPEGKLTCAKHPVKSLFGAETLAVDLIAVSENFLISIYEIICQSRM